MARGYRCYCDRCSRERKNAGPDCNSRLRCCSDDRSRRCRAADVEAGKTAFKKCALCHTTEAGKSNKLGPILFGIVGRKSASLENFNYSEGMKKYDHTWDDQTLDLYLTDPRATVPGTSMIFPGIKNETERDDVIAYLETLK
jgi:cytochrome c